jgi:chromosome segregation ATPase
MAPCTRFLLAAATAGVSLAAKESVTPIQKVLQMMGEMKEKAIAEKNAEETAWSKESMWCKGQLKVKTKEIADADTKMTDLTAAIEENVAEIRDLTDRIKELEEDVVRWKKDQKAATAVRENEKVDFRATVADYGESIDALKGASATLKKQQGATAQASLLEESFLQVSRSKMVPDEAKSALAAFLQGTQASQAAAESSDEAPDEMLHRSAPEAAGYESQSGGIVQMLEDLLDDFVAKKTDLEKEELNAEHAYGGIMQHLTDNIEKASQEISRKTKRRAETEAAKGENEGNLKATTSDREEDATYLQDTTIACEQKAADFAASQELRAGEIEAVSKAAEIIGSSAVKGAGEKNLPAASAAASLVQLKSGVQSPLQERVVAFLEGRAQSSGSRVLLQAAQQVAANPFVKVKKMIKDLISKLMEEATAETEAKGWCDTELGTNKITREARTEDANNLNAEIEDLNAEIADLTQTIADLAAKVKELEAAMAEATENRMDAKATNEQTIKEAQEAQTAVEAATAVLKDFYAKAGESGSVDSESGGSVLSFLEVILSDFARLESETTSAEQTEADQYDDLMFESKKDKTLKEGESKNLGGTLTDKQGALETASEELKGNQDQLDKANAYYDKLKPTCVDSGITYEDRVKAREAEIQSLGEALKILQGV